MNILGTVAEALKDMATSSKVKLIGENSALMQKMNDQSQEFHRRYTNVK